jgi:HD superfamily phosphohydrolase
MYFRNEICQKKYGQLSFRIKNLDLWTSVYNKKKIINDPLYGFIGIPSEIVFDLISHPWIGRLRNIRQLGLTHFVYPGAVHTRFHHALGTLHLANLAIETLVSKGVDIHKEEADGLRLALLLHDIGHSPFSHSLERVLVKVSHETITGMAMNKLDSLFPGKLEIAQAIFHNTYPRKFFHQLVSGQMDLDRLDYLNRDSFYTGVSEGVVSFDRIIKMLHVWEGELVLEEKALYSLENFLIARRLMYWQVYLHKTVIASEQLMLKILKRAKFLLSQGKVLYSSPFLQEFLTRDIELEEFSHSPELFGKFMNLDDSDIWNAIKVWMMESDFILSTLSKALIHRNLYHIILEDKPISESQLDGLRQETRSAIKISEEDLDYFVFTGMTRHLAYSITHENIFLLDKDRKPIPFLELSDFFSSTGIAIPIEKYYACHFRF